MLLLQAQSILNNPNENGILVFVLGALFILSLYHFLLYFQQKDKAYLYYSLYNFLVVLSNLDMVKNGFIPILIKPYLKTLNYYSYNIIWLYNIVYFVFILALIDIKGYSLKWYNFVKRSLYFLFILTLLFEFIYIITKNTNVISYGNIIFAVLITILTLLYYIPLFKVKNHIKYYAIFGSFFLLITSVIATIMYLFKLPLENNDVRFSIFYAGVIIENIFFSLGLGRKQKLISLEKDTSQKKLINQLEKNKELQEIINKQLEKKVELNNLEKIKANYKKELAENELYALRTQMNPHFVFNSLAAIQYYINENNFEASEKYLVKFSKLIRKFFELSKETKIALSQEINLLTNYLEIEKLRFREKLEFKVNIDKTIDTGKTKIPTMLLQPIVENAVNHGVFNKLDTGTVTLNFSKVDATSYKVLIIDDGVGFFNTKSNNKKIKSSHVLKERLKYLNSLENWKIKYFTQELHPEKEEKGNISTFIIKFK